MKKFLFLPLLIVLMLFSFQSLWSLEGNVTIHVPYYIGIHSNDEDAGEALDYAFVVPELKLTQYFGTGPVKAGVGIRMFTIIIETLIFPVVSVKAEVSNLVINADIGGGAFLFFGIYSTIETAGIFIPELSIAYKFNSWFQIGTGVNLFVFPEATGNTDEFGYIPTVFCRFTFGDQ